MKIITPDFLSANFFMKDDTPEGINILPHVMPHQVHGKNIILVNDETFTKYSLPERPEADGILLTTSKAEASLRFADCAPVLIWGKSFAMLLHSGYKGTVLNISGYGVELVREKHMSDNMENLREDDIDSGNRDWENVQAPQIDRLNELVSENAKNLFEDANDNVKNFHENEDMRNFQEHASEDINEPVNENVQDLHAWIGPCIGREIYCRDVNDEWTQKGIKSFHRENYDDDGDKIYFDLAGEIKSQLLDAGLDERNITMTGINTYEDDRCYSYRRGDKVKRMMLHVRIKSQGD
ncbi:MAG: polyphenol oxidase family protein [Synergistaceae bacterium]|nr:polyphenol oxidase family protein [Synergistaceae bacterium]